MMKLYARIISLCVTIFLSGCNHSIKPLNDSDLERWIHAYENITAVSPTLLQQKRASREGTLLTCSACRSILEAQVVKAGYSNLPEFFVIDMRIRVAQVDFLHRQMTKAVDSLSQGVKAEAKESCVSSGSSDPDQQLVEHGLSLVCWVLVKRVEQMSKTSRMEDAIISKITIESDVVFVGENYATMDRTLSDQRLIEDYRYDLSPEAKRSPDPQRAQACDRLALGLGDAQDRAKCPGIRNAVALN